MDEIVKASANGESPEAISRRGFLQFAGIVGLTSATGLWVAGCGGSGSEPSGGSATGGTGTAGTAGSTGTAGSAAATGAAGGSISIVLNRSLVTLDNKLNQYDASVTVSRAVRQALTVIGTDLKPHLMLAESFEQTEPTVWTVKLRSDIKYSDNSPVTVEDVQTALSMYFQVESGYVASQFPGEPTFTKIDDTSFTLTTEQPLASLNSLMSNILITPAAANKPEDLTDGIGTGPFVVAEADSGTGTYKLVRNENYWGEPALLDEVNVSYQEEESARVIAIQSGQADVIDTITPDSANALADDANVDVVQEDGTRFIHMFYNFRQPEGSPMANPRVREALTYAIDSESLISSLMNGLVKSATGVVPSTLAGYADTGSYSYDPEKAKSMLAEEGASDLSLIFIWEEAEFAGAAQVMEAIQAMLKEVGVTVELKQIPKGGEITEWRRGEAGPWDVIGNGYGNQTGLAITNLVGQYGGTPEKEAEKDTYMGFVQPDIAALLDQAAGEPDEDTRNGYLKEAQDKIWALWPALWAWIPDLVLAKTKRVTAIELSPANSYDLATVEVSG